MTLNMRLAMNEQRSRKLAPWPPQCASLLPKLSSNTHCTWGLPLRKASKHSHQLQSSWQEILCGFFLCLHEVKEAFPWSASSPCAVRCFFSEICSCVLFGAMLHNLLLHLTKVQQGRLSSSRPRGITWSTHGWHVRTIWWIVEVWGPGAVNNDNENHSHNDEGRVIVIGWSAGQPTNEARNVGFP